MKAMVHTAALVLTAALLIPAASAKEGGKEAVRLPREEAAAVTAVQPEQLEPPIQPIQPVQPAQEVRPEEKTEGWKLLLVNPWNPLPEDFTVELKQLSNGMQVDARIYDDLEDMLSDCWEAGLRPVVCSAYRSEATQTRLHNNKIARLQAAGYSRESARKEAARWVAVPGTSEHQTGMAVDIVASSYQVLNRRQENTAEQKWLMEHCWEYGFILRYASEKSEITGIGYEPWHYRYVGRETALAIRDSGLCLEEYLQTLDTAQLAAKP